MTFFEQYLFRIRLKYSRIPIIHFCLKYYLHICFLSFAFYALNIESHLINLVFFEPTIAIELFMIKLCFIMEFMKKIMFLLYSGA